MVPQAFFSVWTAGGAFLQHRNATCVFFSLVIKNSDMLIPLLDTWCNWMFSMWCARTGCSPDGVWGLSDVSVVCAGVILFNKWCEEIWCSSRDMWIRLALFSWAEQHNHPDDQIKRLPWLFRPDLAEWKHSLIQLICVSCLLRWVCWLHKEW